MQTSHHLFLGIGVEAGIIALVALIAIFAVVLWKGVLLIRSVEDTYPKELMLAMLASVVGYIVMGMTTGEMANTRDTLTAVVMLSAV